MRTAFDIFLLLAAILAPLSATLSLMVLGLCYFPRYFESVGIALMMDFLYRGGGADMFGSHLPLAVLALLALCAVEVLRIFIRERRA